MTADEKTAAPIDEAPIDEEPIETSLEEADPEAEGKAGQEAEPDASEDAPEDSLAAPEEALAIQQKSDEMEPVAAEETKSLLEEVGVLSETGDDEAITALKNMEAKRKREKRSRIIKIVVAVAVIAVALILFLLRDTLFPAPTPEVVPETVEIVRQDFTTTVQGSGSLMAGSTALVTPEVSGIIDEVLVKEGQYVEAGEVVATIRNADLDKEVSSAASQVSSASTEVYNAQVAVADLQQSYYNAVDNYNWSVEQNAIDVSNAKTAGDAAYTETYEKEMAKIPDDASKEERKRLKEEAKEKAQQAYQAAYDAVPITEIASYDDATYVSEIDTAQQGVATAQQGLTKAQDSYNEAVANADKRNVKAPASGTVLALEAVPGAAVGGATGGTSNNTSSSGSLMQISDMTRLKVSIEVNEVDILAIAEGQKAKVTFSAIPELELPATVSSVASVATGSGDSGNGGGGGVASFKVALDIDEVDERLKPGMTATVNIITQNETDAIVIPTAALQEEGEKAYVKIVTGDDPTQTELREVKVGLRSSSEAVIESGLKEGETIAYGGASLADLAGGEEIGEDAPPEAEAA